MRTLVAVMSTKSDGATYWVRLFHHTIHIQQRFEDARWRDFGRFESCRGDGGCELPAQRRKQLRSPESSHATQLDVDERQSEQRGTAFAVEVEQKSLSGDRRVQDAAGSAATACGFEERRQGIRGRGFNCKSDDRLFVPSSGHPCAQLGRVDGLRALQGHVDAAVRILRTERSADAGARERFARPGSRFAAGVVDSQRPRPIHDASIVKRVNATFPALVVSVGKNAARVVLDSEDAPRVADLKRAVGKRAMLAPGDRVRVHLLEDGRAKVDAVEDRTFSLARRSAEGRSKTMAANVDTIVTVTSLAQPPPRLRTLDQLLAFAELEDITALVVFTKADLAPRPPARALFDLYESLDYATLTINPRAGENIEALRDRLAGRHAMLCGVSGVGKSSTFRALGGEAVIGEVSRRGIGRQTTSAARLYRMPGGFLIDSPGVAEFGLGTIAPAELVDGFREMRPHGVRCRFTDCTHVREPGCAVRQAVRDGAIAASRYESFCRILGAAPDLP